LLFQYINDSVLLVLIYKGQTDKTSYL